MDRSQREREAYDERGVFEHSHGWHARFKHVFECPNSLEYERLFAERIRTQARGRRVLEIGCGDGAQAEEILSCEPRYVRGIDISEKFVARARQREVAGRLEFANQDAMGPIDGRYDLILGRAILHHLDYRSVLSRLFDSNLSPGGVMIFMEPLGSNALIRLFHLVAPSAHTPDERPFYRADLRWLRGHFQGVQVLPINFLSFPLGLLSSLVFRRADNAMMRACDRVDRWIARHLPFLGPSFRQAIFVITK